MLVGRNGKPVFENFTITITIESEEEARALYAICNHADNDILLPNGELDKVRDAIGDRFEVKNNGDVIANGVTYEKWYCSAR